MKMRTPIFVSWLKYQWRMRRAKTVAGALLAELDYINAHLSKLQRRKMGDINMMRMTDLFHRRNFLMTYLGPSDCEE